MPAKEWVASIVEKINKDEKAKNGLRKWIGTYYGKIIGWHVGEDRFFVIFTKNGAKLVEGEYPSPEVELEMDNEEWEDVIKNKHSFDQIYSSMKAEKLVVRRNLNELYNFSKFLEVVGI